MMFTPNSNAAFLHRLLLALVLLIGVAAVPARAVPSFAVQTGQACQACHVGGLGPQLTPFGRNFKLNGYTMRAVDFNVPIAAMAIASYTRTKKDAADAVAPGFGTNGNIAVDQVSLFVAGGVGQHLGGFAQITYDGIAKAWAWDNLDIRAVTHAQIAGTDVLFGTTLHNAPGVQDVWNTLSAWGFPYTDSALAPGAPAAPLMSGGLAQSVLGASAYAWIGGEVYLEAAGYWSPGASTLSWLGADPYAPGNIHGAAPYGRVAWAHDFGNNNIEIGAFGLWAHIYPERDRSTGMTDNYADLGADAAWQLTLANGDMVTANARYTHEKQTLDASAPLFGTNATNTLTEIHADASYYLHNKYGATVSWFDSKGSADAVLYADSARTRPDTSGVTFQLDATPWGDGGLPGPYVNVRVGVQYTVFTKFAGDKYNFDGNGANASDNNTARVFAWFVF